MPFRRAYPLILYVYGTWSPTEVRVTTKPALYAGSKDPTRASSTLQGSSLEAGSEIWARNKAMLTRVLFLDRLYIDKNRTCQCSNLSHLRYKFLIYVLFLVKISHTKRDSNLVRCHFNTQCNDLPHCTASWIVLYMCIDCSSASFSICIYCHK